MNALRHNGDGSVSVLLSGGVVALIDEDDVAKVVQYRWIPTTLHYGIRYASACKGNSICSILMHRLVLCVPKGYIVDHINGNGLDNRKANLRIATRSLNSRNHHRRKATAKSLPVGVMERTRHVTKWTAMIRVNRKRKYLGTFNSPEEAGAAYQKAKDDSIREAMSEIPYRPGASR